MDDIREEESIEPSSDNGAASLPAPQTVPARNRWPLALAALGLTSSVAGLVVEIAWWEDVGYKWQSLYRFFASGVPFWWSLGLSLFGGAATWWYWRNSGRSRWLGIPGLLVASAWAARMVFGLVVGLVVGLIGLVILGLKWFAEQFGADIVEASLPKKQRRKHRTQRRKSHRKRGYKRQGGRKGRRRGKQKRMYSRRRRGHKGRRGRQRTYRRRRGGYRKKGGRRRR